MRLVTFIGLIVVGIIISTLIFNDLIYTPREVEDNIASSGISTEIKSINWDIEKVTSIKDTEDIELPLPKGYIASNATGENTVKNGFVIYEGYDEVNDSNVVEAQKNRNQYVWVPVNDINQVCSNIDNVYYSKNYTYNKNGRVQIENISESTIDESLKQEIKEDYQKIIESITQYGGFYIGRYEIGNISGKLNIVKGNGDISTNDWKTLYRNIKNLNGTNEDVITRMIPSSLYDETLNWFTSTNSKVTSEIGEDSKFWGNYKNSSFTYIGLNGENINKVSGTEEKIPTGSTEYTKVNNIYDLAGNMWEWVIDSEFENLAKIRGGGYSNYGSIYAGYLFDCENDTVYEKGGRAILCIN